MHSINTDFYLVNFFGTPTIRTFKEIQSGLGWNPSWLNGATIHKMIISHGEKVTPKHFVPKKYRTNKLIDKNWYAIWNKEEE